jgi:hypothetical protein
MPLTSILWSYCPALRQDTAMAEAQRSQDQNDDSDEEEDPEEELYARELSDDET